MTTKSKKISHTPSILIWHDKHGKRLYLADTLKKLHAAALKILQDRVELGYICPKNSEDSKWRKSVPPLTRAQVEALPPGRIKAAARLEWENYDADQKFLKEEQDVWVKTQKALEEKDGKLAWWILQGRMDFEYEKIELIPYEDVK